MKNETYTQKIHLYLLWVHWVFVTARGLSLAVESGAALELCCTGFSISNVASPVVEHRPQGAQASEVAAHGLSSCDPRAPEPSRRGTQV